MKARRGWRKLKPAERAELVRLLSARVPDQRFDVMRLAPKGSFLARMLRHFDETDISYSMPLMSTVMFAASWLTQNGASLAVPGVGAIRPTLWNYRPGRVRILENPGERRGRGDPVGGR